MMKATSACVVGTSQCRLVQMLAQKIETSVGYELIFFWGLGSQETMLTHKESRGGKVAARVSCSLAC
jgi:hypothetical protein